MKVVNEVTEISREGDIAETGFTIKATGKAFDILSSGLYSDKPLAVVRELACNAYDSHVAAGHPELPIEIHLPSALAPTFYVKDFGTGLSDFQVRGFWRHVEGREISLEEGDEANLIHGIDGWKKVGGIYNTYFESTKTTSNDFIGQLGLGSKSPFSYASTFIVESRFNGVKRVYTCFKNEHNMPAIALTGEEPTDEPNGMTISLAVRREDVDKFTNAASKALMYFNPTPNVLGRDGFKPFALRHTVAGSGWKIRDSDYFAYMKGPYVVQGFVAYPIDGHQLVEHGMTPAAAALTGVDIDFAVEIGKVEVAASREALSYNRSTIKNLIAVFEAAALELRKSFQERFDECKTAWEAALLLDRLEAGGTDKLRKIFKEMHRTNPFQWNGADVTTTVKLDLRDVKHMSIARYTTSRSRKTVKLNATSTWQPGTGVTVFEFNLQGNTHVLIDSDVRKWANDAVRDFIVGQPNREGREASAIVIRPIVRGGYSQQDVDAIISGFGHPETRSIDDLPRRATGGYTPGKKRAPEMKLVFTKFPTKYDHRDRENGVRRTFSRLTWEQREIDINAGGFYVQLDRFTPRSNNTGALVVSLDDIITDAKKLGLLPEDAVVVGLNEKEERAVHKSEGEWFELFTFLKSEFAETNEDNVMYSRLVSDKVFEAVGAGVRKYLVEQWDHLRDTVADGAFKQAVERLVDLNAAAGRYPTATVERFTNVMRINRAPDARIESMPSDWRRALYDYEMLRLVALSENSSSWVTPVINYVNLVDGGK